jgi:hypothetical protein
MCFKKPVTNEVLYYVRFEVFTAVTMKNTVFSDIKTQFIPHRRHITSRYKAQPVDASKD